MLIASVAAYALGRCWVDVSVFARGIALRTLAASATSHVAVGGLPPPPSTGRKRAKGRSNADDDEREEENGIFHSMGDWPRGVCTRLLSSSSPRELCTTSLSSAA